MIKRNILFTFLSIFLVSVVQAGIYDQDGIAFEYPDGSWELQVQPGFGNTAFALLNEEYNCAAWLFVVDFDMGAEELMEMVTGTVFEEYMYENILIMPVLDEGDYYGREAMVRHFSFNSLGERASGRIYIYKEEGRWVCMTENWTNSMADEAREGFDIIGRSLTMNRFTNRI